MTWDEMIYQYDGSFEGFLCCIYESYINKEFPIAFCGDEECFSLYAVRCVITNHAHAQRVLRGLEKLSPSGANILRRAFLTCMEDKEKHMYAFARKLFSQGGGFLKNQSDETYHPLAKAIRHMGGEVEKLRGFVRFSDYGGVLGAEIEPKNRVLPMLRSHFCNRCANEAFFIYDRTHRELLLYADGRSRILHVDQLTLDMPGEEEVHYRALWKRFYDAIAIRERFNPKCQNTRMPKRYRSTMTEFLPVDHERSAIPSKAPEVFPGFDAPGAIPAPETPR